jgi:hypothetical protein
MSDQMVSKVVLSTNRVVLLRDVKIKHTRLAAQAAAPKAKGDQNLLAILMQEEFIKLLIVQVDGKTPSREELEDLDSLFTVAEFGQLSNVVAQLTGGAEMGKAPAIEIVSFGGK